VSRGKIAEQYFDATRQVGLRSPDLLFNFFLPFFHALEFRLAFMFERLEVYQKAVDFADQIVVLTQDFPRGFGFLADQLNRASVSIATNLAEGNGRFTKPDRKNFFTIARGSAQECVPLLELARRRRLIEPKSHDALRNELEVIAKMISGLINGLHQRES
jgi:four helix bundle protein